MKLAESMRQDWDERARKDAFHYIASWRQDWTEESFFQSGEEHYECLVAPVLGRLRWEPQGKAWSNWDVVPPHDAGFCPKIFACPCLRHLDGDAETRENIESRSVQYRVDLDQRRRSLRDSAMARWILFLAISCCTTCPTVELALAYIREMLRLLKPDGFISISV